MLERKWMKSWIEERLKKNPKDYWLRVPDSAEGTKPFDGVLLTRVFGRTVPIAVEFKVWRKKKPFDFSTVKPHQLRELLRWKRAGGEAWILVLEERTRDVRAYYPSEAVLRRMLKA